MGKTLQTTRDESLGVRINSQKGGIHTLVDAIYIDTRFATLENMLKDFVLFQASTKIPLPQMVLCSQCQSTDHSLSAYPYLLNNWL